MQATTTTTSTVVSPTTRRWDDKRRNAVVAALAHLTLSVLGFCVAVAAYTFTSNVKAGAFWAHMTMILGGAFLLIGVCLAQTGRAWIICGLVFTSIGLILVVVGAIVDGVQAGHVSTTDFDKCRYAQFSQPVDCGRAGYMGTWHAELCTLVHGPETCYCCEIHADQNCDIFGHSWSTLPHKYEGVSSCEAVESHYQQLMWAALCFDILVFASGVAASALAGNYRSTGVAPVTTTHQATLVSYNGFYPTNGPVVFYTQQQAIGYYPHATQPAGPPEYSTTVPTLHPPLVSSGGTAGSISYQAAPVSGGIIQPYATTNNSTAQNPYNLDRPPPYAP